MFQSWHLTAGGHSGCSGGCGAGVCPLAARMVPDMVAVEFCVS